MKYYIGVDLGGTNIAVGLVDENYKIVEKMSTPTKSERHQSKVIEDIASTINAVLEKSGVSIDDCVSVGIGSPGTIDEQTGTVIYANNLRWRNVHLAEELKKLIGLNTYVSNDANCAAFGEVLDGAAKGSKHAVMLTLGTGVGGGIIIDGKIFGGGHPGGAEVGHIILSFDGELCTCGRKGCLESYASATALIRQTKRAMEANHESLMWKMVKNDLNNVNGRTSFNAAKEGDKAAQQVVDNYVAYVSAGILDMINIFRPDMIILGGGIANEGDNLIVPINNYVKTAAYGGDGSFTPPVVKAILGNDAGIVGAAFLGA